MKKLLIIGILTLCYLKGFSQFREMSYREVSPYLIGSGVAITFFAFVTPAEQTYDYHGFQGYSPTPMYNQGSKFLGVVSGVGITITGLIGICTRK